MLCSHTGPNVHFLSSQVSRWGWPIPKAAFQFTMKVVELRSCPCFMRTILSPVCAGIEVVYNSRLPLLSRLLANERVVGEEKGHRRETASLHFSFFIHLFLLKSNAHPEKRPYRRYDLMTRHNFVRTLVTLKSRTS